MHCFMRKSGELGMRTLSNDIQRIEVIKNNDGKYYVMIEHLEVGIIIFKLHNADEL